MEILKGKYEIVNMKVNDDEPAIISVNLKGVRQDIDLTKIDEATADELIKGGSAYLKKKESASKKTSGSS